MRRLYKWSACLIALCAVVSAGNIQVQAAENDVYGDYVITVYAGDKGTIDGESFFSLTPGNNDLSSIKDKIQVKSEYDSNYIFSGNFIQAGAAGEADLTGADGTPINVSMLTNSSVKLEKDIDYVAVYVSNANSIAYTVEYVDTAGNTMLPTATFYGTVGDKVVVAAPYIEGYMPNANAEAKTLKTDVGENVFRFVYTNLAGAAGTTYNTEYINGQNIVVGGNTTYRYTDEGVQTTDGAGVVLVDNNGGGGEGDAGQDTTTVADEQVPLEVLDLDDEDVPQADIKLDGQNPGANGSPNAIFVYSLAAVIVAALLSAFGGIILIKRKNKNNGEK